MNQPPELEKDLVAECQQVAEAFGAFVAFVGQRRARNSGTTTGYPDATVICNGVVALCEFKRPATKEHPRGYVSLGQEAFIRRAAEQGVVVHVVDSAQKFAGIINDCRRGRGVRRRGCPTVPPVA